MSFHDGFFVFLRFMEGILVFYIWENIFLFEKVVGAWWRRTNVWVAYPLFGWDVQRHMLSNIFFCRVLRSSTVSSSLWGSAWKRMVSGFSLAVVLFSFFLSSRESARLSSFFRFFNFSPYVFDCLFSSLVLFIKVFYVFNLALILLIFFFLLLKFFSFQFNSPI